jgi:endoglucanase
VWVAGFSHRLRVVAHTLQGPRFRAIERLAIGTVLLVAALFTGFNMFRFPNYEPDEGTYMGSAWALFEQGNLSYYTYTYDHPPFGWFQIGAWAKLVGGFLAFGTSVNTGRALMLVVAVLSTLLIFLIVRRATESVPAALLAAVVFAVSPLGVGLHRQVWLDNVATLWLLASLFALLAAEGRLGRIVLSAFAFGLAFLSKEIMVVFLPGMLYLAYSKARITHRDFAVILWGGVAAFAMSLFAVLALLKDEFLPPGVLWSSPEPHVSLLETFRYQASRGGGGSSIFSLESDFRTFFAQWIEADALLILGGLAAATLGLLFYKRDRFLFGVSLLTLSFVLLLGRGGVVLHFYVIPLLALLALSLGLLAGHVLDWASRREFGRWGTLGRPAALAALGLAVCLVIGAVPANGANFTGDATSSQGAAARWIAENLPNESVILMDAYPWADLRDEKLVGDEPFEDAHYPLTALQDPAIRDRVLRNDPGNIDYLLHSPTTNPNYAWIDGEANERDLSLVDEARKNSDSIKTFSSKDWEMEILRVRNLHRVQAPDNPVLANAWESYKKRFVKDGRVVDPKAGDLTTSEAQAYAMLRAVYMDDQEAFDKVWSWTQKNLQVRGDGLLAWNYGETADDGLGVADPNSAADADTDAALALLFAARTFGDAAYEEEAVGILNDVWAQETAFVGGQRVAVAGDWARGDSDTFRPVVNPSYLSPYAYKIFAEADPYHPWSALVDSSYTILERIAQSPELGGTIGLAPNWVALDPSTGQPSPANLDTLPASEFSFDASRIPWRISLDALWFGDPRAERALNRLSFPRKELGREGRLLASYYLDGTPAADYEATSLYAGLLPGLLFNGDPALAHRVFTEKILGAYNTTGSEGAYWGEDRDDYYNQNLAWFATAVMDGSMGNLYAGEKVIEWDRTSVQTSPTGR